MIFRLLRETIIPILSLCFLVYITPIDHKLFRLLNNSVVYSKWLVYFWGYMNHNNEKWINVIAMLGVNVYGYYLSKDKPQYAKDFFYAVLWFQVVLLLNHLIINKYLNIHRYSPSIVHKGHFISLQVLLNNPDIKVYSTSSFPSGHALAAMYWMRISHYLLPKNIYWYYVFPVGYLISVSRLFSGAHWVSDVIFSFLMAKIWALIYFEVKYRISLYQLKKKIEKIDLKS